eukprot:gnl/MRDRNA2_/MRDRNA2_208038_c0_seq1.p2 gnl/MRDRNA2_/MRDRNA2_208038_c0~~gnl/MRDRNA2_/MRDRNA2_208038_c0_seq1.p2  ORF type:complete len:109 (+),score=22.44 gnl/MRDRNA2_/MRDRNA2_208038_c0_seq1:92-418(+)
MPGKEKKHFLDLHGHGTGQSLVGVVHHLENVRHEDPHPFDLFSQDAKEFGHEFCEFQTAIETLQKSFGTSDWRDRSGHLNRTVVSTIYPNNLTSKSGMEMIGVAGQRT